MNLIKWKAQKRDQGRRDPRRRKWYKIFLLGNIAALLLAPQIFFGVYGTIFNIAGGVCNNTQRAYVKQFGGRMALDLIDARDNWIGAVEGMNPLNWTK